MHKRGLCRRVVSVTVSVTFVYYVETAKDSCYVIRIGNRKQVFEWYQYQ